MSRKPILASIAYVDPKTDGQRAPILNGVQLGIGNTVFWSGFQGIAIPPRAKVSIEIKNIGKGKPLLVTIKR